MKKVDVFGADGKKAGTIDLPEQFSEGLRTDVIRRAVLAIASHNRQPYGTDPWAGTRTSASFRGERGVYGSWANRGMHRTSRIRIGTGYQTGTARMVPGAVKGRRAHPPKAEKIWDQKINAKERKLAIRSGIAATSDAGKIAARGHKAKGLQFPIVADDKIAAFRKTKDAVEFMLKIGLAEELHRIKEKRVRAGKGKTRGRKYRTKKGPLVVVAGSKNMAHAFSGISGVDVVAVKNLNADVLAPGAAPGRLTIWTKGAVEALAKEKLFM